MVQVFNPSILFATFQIYILTAFIILKAFSVAAVQEKPLTCGPINFSASRISCTIQPNSQNSTHATQCSKGTQHGIGTVVKYKCKPHFISSNGEADRRNSNTGAEIGRSAEHEMRCGANGKWSEYSKFNAFQCREECGKRFTNPKPLIVNGVPTDQISWPWHATLFRRSGSKMVYICGGSVINRLAVLTAAHCVTSLAGSSVLPNSTVVVLGATTNNFTENLRREGEGVQIFNVRQIFVSESYDAKKEFQADIAILHLDKEIEYNDRISPVCLPLPTGVAGDADDLKVGKLADVVGFGVDESGRVSSKLKHGALEIKSHSDCFAKMHRILSESQICAGSRRGDKWVTVCNSDSGGGLVLTSLVHQKNYIHGIVSSGDSLNSGSRVCESYAVFTRVSSFVSWIRVILEEINGGGDWEYGLDLASSKTYRYSFKGTPTRRRDFYPIPMDWTNRIGSIDLDYIDIAPETLLKSLEYSKTVTTLNFTHVTFKHEFPPRKVLLPQLKSVRLEILRDDFRIKENRDFPLAEGHGHISNKFIESFIFFEKKFEEGENGISGILVSKIDFELIIHIFKLVQINATERKITMSQIESTNEILETVDFQIKHLSLSRCSLDLVVLEKQFQIESLILDQVDLDFSKLTTIIKQSRQLRELVFVPPAHARRRMIINLNYLPKALKHLSLTKVDLNYTLVPSYSSKSNQDFKNDGVSNLETFFCNLCSFDQNSLTRLHALFPKLKQIVLRLPNLPKSRGVSLKRFVNLESAYFFVNSGFQKFGQNANISNINDNLDHFIYKLNRLANFWTSESEYICLTRLSATEQIAFDTGHYRFAGNLPPFPDGTNRPVKIIAEDRFSLIPKHIQGRLHTLEIFNAEVLREDFEGSLKYAKGLKHIRMFNFSLVYLFREPVELPALIEYNAMATASVAVPLFGYRGFSLYIHKAFDKFFPFREERVDMKTHLLNSKVRKIRLQGGDCVGVSWDMDKGVLISVTSFTNDWLNNYNASPFAGAHPIKKLAFKYKELDGAAVPTTVTNLNLNFAVISPEGVRALVKRLSALKVLRFINVRARDNDDFVNWVWSELNLVDLATAQGQSLEYIAVQKAHLIYRSGMAVFPKVHTIYIEDCTFDEKFSNDFPKIFPEVRKVVILAGNSTAVLTNDILLVQIINSPRVKLIVSDNATFHPERNVPKVKSQFRQRAEAILKNSSRTSSGLRVNRMSKYVVLERSKMNSSWFQQNVSPQREVQLAALFFRMTGTTDFGTAWNCHAYRYAEGISAKYENELASLQ